MAERSSYEPGTFCWAELVSKDTDGAKAFYTALFGWEPQDNPVGDGGVYTIFRQDGHQAAALHAGQDGMPPHWGSYVSVEDADASADKAKQLGATVLAGPFDVMEAGRMAVIQDPQGAIVSVWQPREHIGAEVVNAPAALTLNQLNTTDTEAAGRFYSDLFGWEVRAEQSPGQPYWGLYNGGRINGGLMDAQGDAPPHWMVYFGSDDIDASVEKIGELGGQVLVPPMPIPSGRIAVAQDPQGAFFALFEGRFDD